MLSVPLRLIDEEKGGIGEAAATALVMNSALKVELNDGVYYEPPTSIDLDETEADIPVGDSITLTADVLPGDATIKNVTWNSSNNRVATVSQSGVVTRVGTGSATITARTVASDLTATFKVTGMPVDFEIESMSTVETVLGGRKDITVTVVYKSNFPAAGGYEVELFYGGAPYTSEIIDFEGIADETITRSYVIKDIPADSQNNIEARINYEWYLSEEDPDNNFKTLASLTVPVPQNDFSVLFINSPEFVQNNKELTITVAFINDSYYAGNIPVGLIYDGQIYESEVVFTGRPFEAVTQTFTVNAGTATGVKTIEARINYANRLSEEEFRNNLLTKLISIQ